MNNYIVKKELLVNGKITFKKGNSKAKMQIIQNMPQ